MNKTKEITRASMIAALIFIVTLVIKIPVPKGYINLGDTVILISSYFLAPSYSFLASGIGSFLSDMVLGYTVYAPVTFLIKGFMTLILCFFKKRLSSAGNNSILPFVTGGIFAELFMILGYFFYESFLYGLGGAIANTPVNIIQGSLSLMVGIIFIRIINKKNKL